MSGQPRRAPRTAPRHLTSGSLTAGVFVSGACFVVAGAAEVFGVATHPAQMTDVGALVSGLAALDPWAWASLGTYAVVATPAMGLVATAYEYSTVADRSTVALALVVLAVLALSAVVALAR